MLCASVIWGVATVAIALRIDTGLGAGAASYAFLLAIYGAGNACANLAMIRVVFHRAERTLFLGCLLWSLGWIGFGWAPGFASAAFAAALAAAGGPLIHLPLQWMIQTGLPDDQLARVSSLRTTGLFAGNALGMFLAAPLLEVASPRDGLTLVAAPVAVGACIGLRALRR